MPGSSGSRGRSIRGPRCKPANTGSIRRPASTDVFSRLGRGDVFYFSFTVPEGSNMFDIARLLESEGIMSGQDFLKAAQNLEGFLFPSTYRVGHFTTPAALCQMMTAQFHKEWTKLMPDAADGYGQDGHARLDDRERDRNRRGTVKGRQRVSESLEDRHDARLRPHGDLRRAARRPLPGRDPSLRLGQREPVQHLPARRFAARTHCQSWCELRWPRRFIRPRPTTCISSPSRVAMDTCFPRTSRRTTRP